MLAKALKIAARSRDEAEKPFWISYADLMTALMVLFLVVMSVALLAVTRKVSEQERLASEHNAAIEQFLNQIEEAASKFEDVHVDRNRKVIDFGRRAQFELASYQLTPEQGAHLRAFVPSLLDIALSDLGKRVLKRVVIEGFTDHTGSYLYNLNLSLQRSEAVLCAFFAPPLSGEIPLSEVQLAHIRDLFVVGGYSFNSARPTAAESRRVELRLELYGVAEKPQNASALPPGNFGICQLR